MTNAQINKYLEDTEQELFDALEELRPDPEKYINARLKLMRFVIAELKPVEVERRDKGKQLKITFADVKK